MFMTITIVALTSFTFASLVAAPVFVLAMFRAVPRDPGLPSENLDRVDDETEEPTTLCVVRADETSTASAPHVASKQDETRSAA